MKGLIIKDLYVIKRYARATILVALIFAAVGLMSANNASFTGMISMMSTMMVINAFSYDDLAKWDRYALAMPISRKTMVGARYLLGFCLWLGGVLLALVILLVSMIVHQQNTYQESLMIIAMIGAGMLMATAISLPMLYKFGVEKGRILLLLAFLPPVAVAIVPVMIFGEGAMIFLIAVFPVASLAMYAISYGVSVNIVRKRDY